MEFIAHSPFLFYLIVLISSVLSSSFGIGSFILLPIAAIVYGPKESVGIITIYFLFQNINKITVFWKHINWNIGIKMILWSLPGALLGSSLLSLIPAAVFNKILGGFILAYLINDIFKIIPKSGYSAAKIPFFGILYGCMSGLIGSGNLVKGPLFTSLGMLNETYIATYALTSLFMNMPKLGVYYATGIIGTSAFTQAIPFLIISILGTYIGKHLLQKVTSGTFYYVVNIAFALSAISLLFE